MRDFLSFHPWRPHPWHGLSAGPQPPELVHAYIEITPFDVIKYEIDKTTGYMRADRPQRSSAQPPALYGFVPRTYCGPRVSALCPKASVGDGDPLDICVLSERPIARAEVVLSVRVIGGFQMIDNGEADDKIVGILHNDLMWDRVRDIRQAPEALIERLEHYFTTYKLVPGHKAKQTIAKTYGAVHARKVVTAAIRDYDETFAKLSGTGTEAPRPAPSPAGRARRK